MPRESERLSGQREQVKNSTTDSLNWMQVAPLANTDEADSPAEVPKALSCLQMHPASLINDSAQSSFKSESSRSAVSSTQTSEDPLELQEMDELTTSVAALPSAEAVFAALREDNAAYFEFLSSCSRASLIAFFAMRLGDWQPPWELDDSRETGKGEIDKFEFANRFAATHCHPLEVAVSFLSMKCTRLLCLRFSSIIPTPLVPAQPPLIHVLIARAATSIDSDGEQRRCASFLRQLSDVELLTRSLDVECIQTGSNALEFAVFLGQFSLFEAILRSSRYSKAISQHGIASLWSLDLSDYHWSNGARFHRHPLLILCLKWHRSHSTSTTGYKSTSETEAMKSFLSSPLARRWVADIFSELNWRWRFMILAMLCIFLLLITVGTIRLYSIVYLKESDMSNLDTHFEKCLGIELIVSTNRSLFLRELLRWLVLFVDIFGILLSAVLLLSYYHLQRLVNGHEWFSQSRCRSLFSSWWNALLLILMILFPVELLFVTLYVRTDSYFLAAPVNDSVHLNNAERNQAFIVMIHSMVFCYCFVLLLFIAFLGSALSKHCCLLVNLMPSFLILSELTLLTVCIYSWLFIFMMPCEPAFTSYSTSSWLSTLIGVFQITFSPSLSLPGYQSMSIVYILYYIIVSIFLFNFMIALLSDRVARISSDLDFRFDMTRLLHAFASQSLSRWIRSRVRSVFRRNRGQELELDESEYRLDVLMPNFD